VARRIVGSREEAEDVVQESFLKALDRIDSFQLGRPFSPWFLRIVANRSLNRRKSLLARRLAPIPDALPADEDSPEDTEERRRVRQRVTEALGELSEKQRLVVRLFELDGFSGREIAEMLGMQEPTVRWTLHAARRKLRTLLTGGGERADA
jgi:RNA polymerase sigma-70 factor (ECF subfamily)